MDIGTLGARVAAHLAGRPDGRVQRGAGMVLLRSVRPTALQPELYEPVVCLVVQGRKEVCVGEGTRDIGPGDALLVSHDTLVSARITEASVTRPYLAIVLRLDLGLILTLAEEVGEPHAGPARARSAMVHAASPHLIDALGRYADLGDDPAERRVMEPLLAREVHFRLLTAPNGGMLRELLRPDSPASRVSRAIVRIRRDFRSSLAMPDLARETG